MSGWIPPGLRALLGDDLDGLIEPTLTHLVGLSEDTQLEFKREPYGASEAEKKELALDVAAFANAGGGLIVIGIEEDRAIATGIRPAPGDDKEEALRVHQVAASRIDPTPTVNVGRIEVAEGFVWVLSIPPSPRAPHAVSSGDTLRYVVRDGPGRRTLTEAEVADRYSRRFAGVVQRDQALHELMGDGYGRIVDDLSSDWSWLLLALVPDMPGNLSLRRGLAAESREWVAPALAEFPGLRRGAIEVLPGFRSLDLFDTAEDRSIYAHGGRLKLDGSGYLLLGYPGGQQEVRIPEDATPVYDEHLWGDLINGLGTLARHANRAGSAGEAQVAARLVSTGRPMVLAEYRSMFKGTLAGTHRVTDCTGVSHHTVPLDSCVVPSAGLVSSARLIATDLVSAFGAAEPQQLTRGSAFALNRFAGDHHDALKRWAEAAGVEILPEWSD